MSKHNSDAAAMSDLSEQLAVALERAVDKLSDIPDKRFFPPGSTKLRSRRQLQYPALNCESPRFRNRQGHLAVITCFRWSGLCGSIPGNSGP